MEAQMSEAPKQSEWTRLDGQVDELHERINLLADRLNPVLTPEDLNKLASVGTADVTGSPISFTNDRLSAAISRLITLTNRIDL